MTDVELVERAEQLGGEWPESWAASPWVWVVGFKRVEVRHG